MVARATRSRCARSKLLRASPWRPTYFVGSRMLPHATNKKARHGDGLFYWYTTTPEVYTQLKQEGRRWREILDPMYREYKLQIERRY